LLLFLQVAEIRAGTNEEREEGPGRIGKEEFP
jgi:hypothetical protein